MSETDPVREVPAGKLASVVTYLEMLSKPKSSGIDGRSDGKLERVPNPDLTRYRNLFRKIGEPYLWNSRLRVSDAELAKILHDPKVAVYIFVTERGDEGLLELDFRVAHECELSFFGLAPGLTGKGIGKWMMHHASEFAWREPIQRFWVHTCTFDDAAAVPFYLRSGFRAYRRQIEIFADPRLAGIYPKTASPQNPLFS